MTQPTDRPWQFRSHAERSSVGAGNAQLRDELARGETGLSISFDLPTQTGYDSDHPLARAEFGQAGVPICHLGDMRALFDGLPLDRIDAALTINATAPWLLAVYVALAEERGFDPGQLRGSVQNDMIKEYLSRGTYICPPEPSLGMATDLAAWTRQRMPRWTPVNICSYHLQEAGATPEQELGFALASAIALLDDLRRKVKPEHFPEIVGQVTFFVSAGLRFVTELCKMRAFVELWDEICRDRYGIEDAQYRRFRYGVRVNSLGLTAQQPENNASRILLEMLGVTLSKNARALSVQLPAWNEALGQPQPWDRQWSIRMQQILAHETDLLEYEDIFDGNPAIEAKVHSLKQAARDELARIDAAGGAVQAIGDMKSRLVEANAARIAAIENNQTTVVGVNRWQGGATSPLPTGHDTAEPVDAVTADDHLLRLAAWRETRDGNAVQKALLALREAAKRRINIMGPSVACAKAGVTTGEWAAVMRGVFGDYRAPTGIAGTAVPDTAALQDLRASVDAASARLGRRLTFLVGKPGLDGHSNGAEQIAARAQACGMEVHYEGIRLTPDQIVNAALRERAHVIGLSIFSGSHLSLTTEIIERLRTVGLGHLPLIIGGIFPESDIAELRAIGVARIYAPRDFELNRIMRDIVELVVPLDAVAE